MNEICPCRRCGEPYEAESMVEGVCLDCMDYNVLERHKIDFDKLYQEIDREAGMDS
jgi:hypothetical protein